MGTLPKICDEILKEITSDDVEVRAKFLKEFSSRAYEFSDVMGKSLLAWRKFDANIVDNEKLAHISALMFTAISLHIQSMKLFLSGLPIPAGNAFRQVLEIISLALLCSSNQLDVLDRFMQDKYSTQKAVRDVLRHSEGLGLLKEGVAVLQKQQKFYDKYSHPTKMTIASMISFTEEGIFVGASFDDGKLVAYTKEIRRRVELAKVFVSLIETVKTNVGKW
ncbi:MAG: hypothetical protein C4525_01320 [Desulfarculus sp.]|jgi:hypothetical protein|nr:MAG: hypothetical protein C4525_01320 [Desulfarculus sp.]